MVQREKCMLWVLDKSIALSISRAFCSMIQYVWCSMFP